MWREELIRLIDQGVFKTQGELVSGLLRFSVAGVLGFLVSLFPGGEERGGRKERNEGVRKEQVARQEGEEGG